MNDLMTFVKWGYLDPTFQGYGRLNILCFWTGHNVGRPDGMLHGRAPRDSYLFIIIE